MHHNKNYEVSVLFMYVLTLVCIICIVEDHLNQSVFLIEFPFIFRTTSKPFLIWEKVSQQI